MCEGEDYSPEGEGETYNNKAELFDALADYAEQVGITVEIPDELYEVPDEQDDDPDNTMLRVLTRFANKPIIIDYDTREERNTATSEVKRTNPKLGDLLENNPARIATLAAIRTQANIHELPELASLYPQGDLKNLDNTKRTDLARALQAQIRGILDNRQIQKNDPSQVPV